MYYIFVQQLTQTKTRKVMKTITSEQKQIILKGLYARKEQLAIEANSNKNAGIAYTLTPNHYKEICELITFFESI